MAKRQSERGFLSPGDKYVCSNCFGDYAIQEFIKAEANYLECSYCVTISDDIPIARHIDDVIEFILEGIETEWDDPRNGVMYDSGEGGWIGIEVIDTEELLIRLDLGLHNEELLDDITESIFQTEWCRNDPYGDRPHEEWYYDWEEFSEQIKHHVRYVFYNIHNKQADEFGIEKEPHEILEKIGIIAINLRLIRILQKGTTIFRCRVTREGKIFSTVDELGPPSPQDAKYANRMSPAGIPMFYGAFDIETTIAETFSENDEYATIVAFKTLKNIKILDLTNLPRFPSIFDQLENILRPSIIFMESFLRDLSKPIEKNDKVHIEYVPTQVVTEYFRHIFQDEDGMPVKGIIYPSSKTPGGISCVLFIKKENCIEDDIKRKYDFPRLEAEPILSMDSSSIKTIKNPIK